MLKILLLSLIVFRSKLGVIIRFMNVLLKVFLENIIFRIKLINERTSHVCHILRFFITCNKYVNDGNNLSQRYYPWFQGIIHLVLPFHNLLGYSLCVIGMKTYLCKEAIPIFEVVTLT